MARYTVGLTDAEHKAIDLTAELMNLLAGEIIGDGPARSQDINEAGRHIHAIQHMVMSQAAARAHPGRYRLLGGSPPG